MTEAPSSLPDRLDSLLFDYKFRELFIADPSDSRLGLTEYEHAAMQGMDLEELAQTTARLRSMVLRGSLGTEGGLRRTFPHTLELLATTGETERDLASRFIASPPYADYREIPFTEKGICLEEAFHEFVHTDPTVRDRLTPDLLEWAEHEFLVALLTHLAVGAEATFRTRTSLVERTSSSAYFAFRRRSAKFCRDATPDRSYPHGTSFLYGASRQGLVVGPAPEPTLAVLRGTASPDEGNTRESRIGHHLRRVGLLAAAGRQ